jgi:hypothetical protein
VREAWLDKPQDQALDAPLKNDSGERSREAYVSVAAQFDVLHAPRYQRTRDGLTWCNIFAWDVTSAMGAEIPHWVTQAGSRAEPHEPGSRAILINEGVDLLRSGINGWRKLVDQREATFLADGGHPAVVAWQAPIGPHHGHIAMWMPGGLISQAGRENLWMMPVTRGFGFLRNLEWFAHI